MEKEDVRVPKREEEFVLEGGKRYLKGTVKIGLEFCQVLEQDINEDRIIYKQQMKRTFRD